MNLLEMFLKEEVDAIIKICRLFNVKHIFINGTKYLVPPCNYK